VAAPSAEGTRSPLAPEWVDHPLTGNEEWKGCRECHIGGDFLLVYKIADSGKHGLVVFIRAGAHTELFNE
jgi:mRNA interferase YafQ